MRTLLPAAIALFAAIPAPAQIAAGEQAAIDVAMARGNLLYWYDQAAWHGTNDMKAKAPEVMQTSGGWIVDGPADAPELIFYDRDTANPKPLYSATFRNGKLTTRRKLSAGDTAMLTPQRRRMIAALAAARTALLKSDAARCADRPFNSVVLPPETADGPVAVYFLTPQTDNATIPMGGHYRFEVGADGMVGPMRCFTKTCIAISINPPKGTPAALVISHLLDPVPTELHAFSAMAVRKPVFVMAGKRLWSVQPAATGPSVRLVKRD